MRFAAVALLACLLGATLPASTRAQQADRIPFRFKRTELSRIIDQLAPALGERFVYDGALSGRVTVAMPRPVSREEAWQLLHAALAMKGFAALPMPAGGYKILPVSAAGSADPWTLGAPSPVGEARILTLIPVHEIAIEDLLSVIRPLLDSSTIAIPSHSTNSLIIASSERRLAALASLVRALDVRDSLVPTLRTLHERDAATALDVINAHYSRDEGRFHGVSAWVDERTNTLIYRAAPAQRREIESLLDQLDQPTELSGEISVIRLHHADAASVVEQLRELASDNATRPGQASALSGQGLNVVAEPATNSLLVNAAPDVLAAVRKIVAQLDLPPKQVEVDILIQEWAYDAGFDLSLSGTTTVGKDPIAAITSDSRGGGFASAPLEDSLSIRVANLPHQIQLVASQSEVDSVTLMRPHLVLLSGEEQMLFRGDNIPIPNSSSGTEETGNQLSNRTTIERHDVGIELRLQATVGEDHATRLEVGLNIQALRSSLAGSVEEVGPTFQQRDVQTIVELLPDQALLIAGHTEGFTEITRTGIPFLMNVPVIGPLVSSRSDQQRRVRIVVAVQVRALPNSAIALAQSIRRRVAFERARATSEALEAPVGERYTLRIATEVSREQALETARQFENAAHPAQVVAWTGTGIEYFDVHLLGFADYVVAADEAFRLNDAGVHADIVPVGPATSSVH